MIDDPFLRKLERAGNLSEDERAALQTLILNRRPVPARRDITNADISDRVYLVMGGFACRYKTLSGGNRRIVSFVLPGDLCLYVQRFLAHALPPLVAVPRVNWPLAWTTGPTSSGPSRPVCRRRTSPPVPRRLLRDRPSAPGCG